MGFHVCVEAKAVSITPLAGLGLIYIRLKHEWIVTPVKTLGRKVVRDQVISDNFSRVQFANQLGKLADVVGHGPVFKLKPVVPRVSIHLLVDGRCSSPAERQRQGRIDDLETGIIRRPCFIKFVDTDILTFEPLPKRFAAVLAVTGVGMVLHFILEDVSIEGRMPTC